MNNPAYYTERVEPAELVPGTRYKVVNNRDNKSALQKYTEVLGDGFLKFTTEHGAILHNPASITIYRPYQPNLNKNRSRGNNVPPVIENMRGGGKSRRRRIHRRRKSTRRHRKH